MNALKRERPDDYYKNAATIEWPLGLHNDAFPIVGSIFPAVVFRDGSNVAAAKEFVGFLVGEGWLMHYLDFSGERLLPTISKLLDQLAFPDPSDPHHMAAVIQIFGGRWPTITRRRSGDAPGTTKVEQEHVWAKAIHLSPAADGIRAQQAVNEAIARVKQMLND